MGLFDLPVIEEGRNTDETVRNLFDSMYKFKKELEFLLVNIDSTNIGSVDGAAGVLADPQKPRIEDVQDIIASTLKEGTGLKIEYDDPNGLITVSIVTEDIQDIIDGTLVSGDGINVVYNDEANTITISLKDITESVQDIMDSTLVAGTGIKKTYNDEANTLTIEVVANDIKDIVNNAITAGTGIETSYNTETKVLTIKAKASDIKDMVNAAIVAGKGIKGTYDTETNKLTLDVDIGDVESPAAFGVGDGDIGGLTISSTYDELEVKALRDKCESLADDCRALRQTVDDLISKLKT